MKKLFLIAVGVHGTLAILIGLTSGDINQFLDAVAVANVSVFLWMIIGMGLKLMFRILNELKGENDA